MKLKSWQLSELKIFVWFNNVNNLLIDLLLRIISLLKKVVSLLAIEYMIILLLGRNQFLLIMKQHEALVKRDYLAQKYVIAGSRVMLVSTIYHQIRLTMFWTQT